MLGRILTLDNLRKRHVIVMDWCYRCKKTGESIDYLLLHCELAIDLWVLVFCLFGIDWVMPKWVVELLASWRGQFGCHHNLEAWRMASLFVMWYIWRECSSIFWRLCENNSRVKKKKNVVKTHCGWMVATNGSCFSNFLEFLDLCFFLP
jgi:hypothetical protein